MPTMINRIACSSSSLLLLAIYGYFAGASRLLDDYSDVRELNQVRIKRQADQCPCVKPKGAASTSSACIAYNSQYQAATLEEAILNFRNPLGLYPERAKALLPGKRQDFQSADGRLECKDDECKQCLRLLLTHFRRKLNAANDAGASNRTLQSIEEIFVRMDLDNSKYAFDECHWLPLLETIRRPKALSSSERSSNSSAEKLRAVKWSRPKDEDVQGILRRIRGDGKEQSQRRQPSSTTNGASQRRKRQATTSSNGNDIYQAILPITCQARGQPLDEGSSWLGMCDACWQLAELTDGFFPKYINQLSCDTDTKCLSGYGTCNRRVRPLTVLKNLGSADSEDWHEYTINVPMACDCQIRQDSALLNLVKD